MKKTLQRLRLDRETLRKLTPQSLDAAVGGVPPTVNDSHVNSCDPLLETRFVCTRFVC